MTMDMWITLGVLCLLVGFLILTRVGTDIAVVGSLVLMMLFGIVTPHNAVVGFVSDGPLMIGGLFVVAAGLRETGAVERVASVLLGRPKSLAMAQLRLMSPVCVLSGFMNTTPIVAMYLPIVSEWAARIRVSPSKLYMPLSFGGIFGGQLSLVGTASNLVILGLFLDWWAGDASNWARELGATELSPTAKFWGVAASGVPSAVLGIGAVMLFSRWLLPARIKVRNVAEDARQYEVAMRVQADAPIVGKTIEQAGLRALPGLFLFSIQRGDNMIHAVSPETVLHAEDQLLFVGIVESVVDLTRIRGLVPAEGDSGARRDFRVLVEAVVSPDAPFLGQTVRKSRFRSVYGAAIIGVLRRGERLQGQIGSMRLKVGDTLLLDAATGFAEAYQDSRDFYLVSTVGSRHIVRHERAWLAGIILVAMIATLMTGALNLVVAVWLTAFAMIGTRCVSGGRARQAINWQVLLTIGGAIGIGVAVQDSGLAEMIAIKFHAMTSLFGGAPRMVLFSVVVATALLAQLVTNYGAATIMFSVAMAAAELTGVRPEPFVFALMAGAGCNFLTPLAYQTNLMVYGPGGYRFTDFARLGAPLLVIVAVCASIMIPIFFPF